MANAPVAQPVSSLSSGMVSHIQNNINSILGNAQDPNPGQTLQHYVSQFQDDPTHYAPVLAMASATQNHLNTQKQLQQSPQKPQPPVAQQAFAQLGQSAPQPQPPQAQQPAPQGAQNGAENSGIGQLPAGNIASMAGGGITGMPSFAGGSGSYVDPAQASMVSNITPDQAMAMGYQNPLYSYGANDQHGSIEGVPMKAGGKVPSFAGDNGSYINDIQPYISNVQNAQGELQQAGAVGRAAVGIPMSIGVNNIKNIAGIGSNALSDVYRGVSGQNGQVPQVATGAPQANPNGANANLTQLQPSPYMSQGLMALGQPASMPQGQPDISAVNPNFTKPQDAVMSAAKTAAQQGASFDTNAASMEASVQKALGDPVNKNQLDLKYQNDEIRKQMIANGVDPDMTKQFNTIQDRQDASDAMLDKKQNLAIMQAGLGMIKSGNPWEAIASGATQGTKAYSDALDQYQQQQQHLADSRMSLEQSKQSLNAGMVDKAMGQVDQATKLTADYHNKMMEGIVSLTNNQNQVLASRANAQTMAGASMYSADAMANSRMYGADTRFDASTQNAQLNGQYKSALALYNNATTPEAKQQAQNTLMLLQQQARLLTSVPSATTASVPYKG